MPSKKIWCVATVRSGVYADSIGTKAFATAFFEKEPKGAILGEITKGQAIDALIEDILDHDDEGLRLGNWVYSMAARKLKEKLKECV